MGLLTSKDWLDPENTGHILLGTCAFLSSCYVLVYRKFIFGEKIDWLSGMWLSYTMTQSIKCVTTVESNVDYGYSFGYTSWPDGIRFFNQILTFVVTTQNLCVWLTVLFNAGGEYHTKKMRTRYHWALKVILALFVVEELVIIILYIVNGNFAWSATAYTTPISICYVIGFWFPSWTAVIYLIRCANKGTLIPIDADKHDMKVTKRFLIVTLCFIIFGIVIGGWSGFPSTHNGRIGKALLGMGYLIPTTALVHYLERFENFKNMMDTKREEVSQKDDSAAAGQSDVETVQVVAGNASDE